MKSPDSQSKNVGLFSLGCKVNHYETQAITEQLENAGFVIQNDAGLCDFFIVNTCTVTQESDRKSRQLIRKLLTKNPTAGMIVTGCSAQLHAKDLAAIDGVDYVIGNREKLRAVQAVRDIFENGKPSQPVIDVPSLDGSRFEDMSVSHFDRTRAYIKIQDGCESRCAYCAIPDARGPVRSKQLDSILSEIQSLLTVGCKEIVLTGIETGSWGRDLGQYRLKDLLTKIDGIPGICRIRLGSLDPSSVTEDFADAVSRLSCMAPHFHMSIQSGCSETLARMKRRYNAEGASLALDRLRAAIPGVRFTADMIAGFPGETEREFAESAAFARRESFIHIHAFPYSKRAGTPAALFPDQIDEQTKNRRVHELNLISDRNCDLAIQDTVRAGKPVEVLVETAKPVKGGILLSGHTPDFLEVGMTSPYDLRGRLVLASPVSVTNGVMNACIISVVDDRGQDR